MAHVPPHAGGWIEIGEGRDTRGGGTPSHPTRVGGLKFYNAMGDSRCEWSHPTRVGGLKSNAA